MSNKRAITIFGLIVGIALMAIPAYARDQIRVVGSSTVYPFIAIAAEEFGENGDFKTPIVESTGTGGGFKLFCQGADLDTPDINDASRAITASEKTECDKNNIIVAEFPIGFDGIVIAGKKDVALLTLTKKDLFLALARELPDKSGKLVKNSNQTWKDIDPTFPARPIMLYGPPPSSGTRDTFVELVMKQGCAAYAPFAKAVADGKDREHQCSLLREDGKYIESGENYNVVVQKLTNNDQALGIIGYGYYEENRSRIEANPIDGITPSVDSIEAGKYGISRKLYVYVKTQHINAIPGIREFLQELTSENAGGPEGYMTQKGLLPLSQSERQGVREKINQL